MKIAIPIGIIVVFVLDLLTPLGIAVPMLYAGPVFTAGLLLRLELGFLTALCCTALTFAAYLLAPPGGISDYAGTNRLIASLLIWLALLISWTFSHISTQIAAFSREHEKDEPNK